MGPTILNTHKRSGKFKHPGFDHMKVVDEFFRNIFHRVMVMKQDRKGLVSE